ncbi:MAG: pyridoxamine 5'-phosphate oxidase family protein [Aggregatilineales bacterium]
MATVHEHITDDLRAWIEAQHLFFVASAPLTGEGHVNVSPKGMDCLRVLDEHTVAYLDLTGSGNETSAHLIEAGNGRITLMWCAFDGSPRILRLYGNGRVILPDTPEWESLAPKFTMLTGARQIIVNEVSMVQTSCGFGVPFFDHVGDRDTLPKLWEQRGEEALKTYHQERNAVSVDGLPTPIGALYE